MRSVENAVCARSIYVKRGSWSKKTKYEDVLDNNSYALSCILSLG